MVIRFVLFWLDFDRIVWYSIFIYAALTHNAEQQHHFLCDFHCHGWVHYVVLQKYSFKVCVISFDFYSTHYKVYIHLPYIITQRRTTAPLNNTHVISSSACPTPKLYQGSADCCEGYRNLDIISLLYPSQIIHYCNQSVLAIGPDMNVLVWSIKMFDIILRSTLVSFSSIMR